MSCEIDCGDCLLGDLIDGDCWNWDCYEGCECGGCEGCECGVCEGCEGGGCEACGTFDCPGCLDSPGCLHCPGCLNSLRCWTTEGIVHDDVGGARRSPSPRPRPSEDSTVTTQPLPSDTPPKGKSNVETQLPPPVEVLVPEGAWQGEEEQPPSYSEHVERTAREVSARDGNGVAGMPNQETETPPQVSRGGDATKQAGLPEQAKQDKSLPVSKERVSPASAGSDNP